MTTNVVRTSPLTRARLAGVLYLMLFFAPFGLVYVPSRLIVPGDAAATASNIIASEMLFRLGIVSNLLSMLVNLFLALALYQLLKHVNRNMALLMVIFILVSAPISMLSELCQFGALLLLSGADYLKVFTADQLHALVLVFLNLHQQGINIAQIFWGLWLFPMGYLVFKSGFLPRILGIFLVIGCLGYLIQSFALFLGYSLSLIFYTSWGELLLPLWLITKGVNVKAWEDRAAEPA